VIGDRGLEIDRESEGSIDRIRDVASEPEIVNSSAILNRQIVHQSTNNSPIFNQHSQINQQSPVPSITNSAKPSRYTRAMRTAGTLVSLLILCALSACGDGDSTPAPAPSPNNPSTITISTAGTVSPTELTVSPGTRVLFRNNDSRRHDMTSDPHPEHTDCPELNQVGLLNPGQNRESGNLVAVRTCGFHDHDDPSNNSFRGRIIIR
jgi:plastocyanin